jgi:hypothetical protein
MQADSPLEHFLDASVARPILLGTQAYQRYFDTQFENRPRYISPFVRMELTRSYLRNIIKVYFLLRLPTIDTISDALSLWSNHFRGSQHKAIEQLMAQLLQTQAFDFADTQNKASALIVVELLIYQFVEGLRSQFRLHDRNSPQCACADVLLPTESRDAAASFKQFIDEFDDVENCRNRCQIDRFLLDQYCAEVENYIQQAAQLSSNANTRGFLRIAENLKEILEQGESACSCKRCERIGDAVIALDSPREMELEHTDNSFDYLCPSIHQPHRKHPSETQIVAQA